MKALVGSPPCSFTVAAIGSVARGEATPYSDLEYIFILEKKTQETVEYFEKLAMTSYFMIRNLRETKLSYMAIDELSGWFDDKSINGLKIDGLAAGAGNIPTGNGSLDTENHYIVTPQELAERYAWVMEHPKEDEALRGDLTAMVTYVKTVYTYQHQHAKHSSHVPDFESLIAKVLMTPERQVINRKMLEADIRKFNFLPSNMMKDKAFTIDVKKEIYRFPSILLLDLAIVFRIRSESAWDTLRVLKEEGYLTKAAFDCLSFLLASACFIRLTAYLFHNSHDDRISVANTAGISLDIEASDTPTPYQQWFVPMGLFSLLCMHMIPLIRQLKLTNLQNMNCLAFAVEVKEEAKVNHIQTLHSCGRHTDSRSSLFAAFRSDQSGNPQMVMSSLYKAVKEPNEVLKCIAQNSRPLCPMPWLYITVMLKKSLTNTLSD